MQHATRISPGREPFLHHFALLCTTLHHSCWERWRLASQFLLSATPGKASALTHHEPRSSLCSFLFKFREPFLHHSCTISAPLFASFRKAHLDYQALTTKTAPWTVSGVKCGSGGTKRME